jgi:ribosomal protein S18 acetylase RimI-like enzyme
MSSEHEETRHSTITKGQVEEFVPTNNNDPVLVQLRHLFVSSFYEYYNTIEPQLNLPKGITLQHWLENAFDEEADELLSHKCRCFLISTPPPSSVIIGFLTIVDTENDPNGIYISQCAIDPIFKRKGYGLLLLKYLTSIFPATTSYTCLCRRVNKPALQFYQKCGAKLIDDGQIATHYGYNPLDYLGFQFTSYQLQS